MLRQLFSRFFAPGAPSATSVPGPTALVQVYERAGRYFVEPSDRTRWSEAGYWVSTGEVTVLESTAADDALGAAVLAALAASRVEVPVPPRGATLEAGGRAAVGDQHRARSGACGASGACTRHSLYNLIGVPHD